MTPLVSYDPLGRAVQVELPNGTLRRVAFDAWSQTTWDENDTAGEAACTAAQALKDAAVGQDTPATLRLDVQGRPYATEELLDTTPTVVVTTLTLDVLGNPAVVTDPRLVTIQTQSFE